MGHFDIAEPAPNDYGTGDEDGRWSQTVRWLTFHVATVRRRFGAPELHRRVHSRCVRCALAPLAGPEA
eukprot:scaffold43910_cov54-Phaeocystis_antarctica.AAC.1